MAPRRGPPPLNTLSPHLSPAPASPANVQFPHIRSNSPSSLTQLLSKPSKWFGRKPSDLRSTSAANEPRSSMSCARKPKISRPTDPRPILSGFHAEQHSHEASRSVADLPLYPKKSLDLIHTPASPCEPSSNAAAGLGNLRSISRKGWSKSVDDLGSFAIPSHGPVDIAFQNRIQEYRNRSGSSGTLQVCTPIDNPSPTSPTHHAFPSIASTVPMSSSPPNDNVVSTEANISISVSSPTTDTFSVPEDPPTPTSRIHAFAPRLPTKLSASKLGLSPTAPRRKDSGESMKDKDGAGGNSTRGVFPFNLPYHAGKHSSSSAIARNGSSDSNMPVPALLTPPVVNRETEVDVTVDMRRISQIIYNSGFLNRLADVTPLVQAHNRPYSTAVNFTLSKGWKPFKAELKGSKLYFYKPPSDRSTAIKELFPTSIVSSSLEEEVVAELETSEEGGKSTRVREEGIIGRKKRAYWGRLTHPELVVGEHGVNKGTFEALVHEAVFGTTFIVAGDSDAVADVADDSRKPGWRDFSAAVLLCLPWHMERAKFENEFIRCSTNLINGADEHAMETERARVGWMAREYLRYYGASSDEGGWQGFISSCIPNFTDKFVPRDGLSGFPKSTSTQAIYVPSPNVPSSPQSDNTLSPNLGTFSPRPQQATKILSLIEALGPSNTVTPSPSGKVLNMKQRPQIPFGDLGELSQVWSTLARDGFTREVLSSIDPHIIALSLQIFHRRMVQDLPGNITLLDILATDVPASPPQDSNTAIVHSSPLSKLSGSDERPHWLTKLLLMQILGPDSSSHSTGAERNPQTPRTHSRSGVISIWVRVGELCRIAGDECSWMAIHHGLCSRPVARLTKAWKRLDRQSLIAVESWVHAESDGCTAAASVPLATAWGGDTKEQIRRHLDQAGNGEESWSADPFMKARDLFDGLRTRLALCIGAPQEGGSVSPSVEQLISFWEEYAQAERTQDAFAQKFQRIDQFMPLSLAVEPRRKGLFEPYFWSQASSGSHASCHPLVPLLFVEPLPTVSLIERSQIWRGRLESGPTKFTLEELQQIRSFEISLRFSGKTGTESSNKDKVFNVGDVDLRGTAIPVYDGELVVVARPDRDTSSASRPASRAPSRPPSFVIDGSGNEKSLARSPSIRVKPGSTQGLERKSSATRRNSLPSISSRPSPVITEVSSERPIRVVVQAGTLDRLVNVLIHGLQGVSVAVADDNGETSLRDGNTRDLLVDHADFARVWWNVFRSFVTPIVFFELLRKRFCGSRPSSNPSSSGPLQVLHYRSEILGTIKEWMTVGGGAQDCLDDAQLYEAVRTFLESPLGRSELDQLPSFEDGDLSQAWEALETMKNNTLSVFIPHTLRPPVLAATNLRPLTAHGHPRNFGSQAPDIDQVAAEDLVDNLNAMGLAALVSVTEEDLFVTADLLEVQAGDKTGWFSTRDYVSSEDVEIQAMYSHLMEIEPSTMVSEMSQDSIYRLLPPNIRSCMRAYNILRKWLISKLVAPKLGVRQRQYRMDLYLRALEIARLRSLDGGSTTGSPVERPCVRSFVEAVITAALLSPESRMHYRPWQNVANIRGVQCDSLVTLLSRQTVPKKVYGDPLVVDICWLLERILEIVSVPNTVSISHDNPQCIINLDKRRHLCDLILNTPTLMPKKWRAREDLNRRDFERLNNIEKEQSPLYFDHRGIRDEAQKEALHAQVSGSISAKKIIRPFQRLVFAQQEKNKRDKYLYDRLSKDKKQEQLRIERRDDYLNKAMRPRKPSPQVQKQHRTKKSYSSAFFHLMRPISSAFTDSTHGLMMKKSPAELDFLPSGKPSLVLSVVDGKVTHVLNNERSYVFQLDTEDGGHYLLQAISKPEMIKWIDQINKVSQVAAKRRLTYLGNSPKPQLADHIHDHVGTPLASKHPTAVFGVELEFLVRREAGGAAVDPGAIPSIISRCLCEVENRGLSEVGIYRIPGAASEINGLREAFNRGEMPIAEDTDIHAVCDLIKAWFRLLPEPAFPPSAYFAVIEAMKNENLDARLSTIRHVVHHLPQVNFNLLKRVVEHLDRVTDYEEHNHMTAEALAIVFSPNLLRAPKNDFGMILANMGYTHKLVKALITHFHVIFDEDHEGDNDVEDDEMEAPILEEDEEEDDIPSQTGEEER